MRIRCCQAGWSSSGVAHAMWWTVPAPWRPGASGAGSYAQRKRRSVPVELVLAAVEVREAEHLGQHRLRHAGVLAVRARAFERRDRVLGRDLGMLGAQRRLVGDHQLEREAVVVLEAQARVAAGRRVVGAVEAIGPEVERRLRSDPELERVDHPEPGAPARGAGELEPGEDRSGRALLVAEVEVVRLGRVEVDGLLDEAEAEDVPRRSRRSAERRP